MKKSIVFFFLLTAMVSQAAPAERHPIVSYPFTEGPCTVQTEKMGTEKGTVKWFHDGKGYGFIISENGTELFVHFRSILGLGVKTLRTGEKVSFDIQQAQKGVQAINVQKLN